MREQITDESAWREAMREVRERLLVKKKPFFFDTYTPSLQYERLVGEIGAFTDYLAKKIVEYVQEDPCRPEVLEIFELTERFNFGPEANKDENWETWVTPRYDEAELRRRLGEKEDPDLRRELRCFEAMTSDDKARLRSILAVLNETKKADGEARNKLLLAALNVNDDNAGTGFREAFKSREKMDLVMTIMKPTPLIKPPTLYAFPVRNDPTLPIFGRHFKDFCCNLRGDDGRGERVFDVVRQVLTKHFPDNVLDYVCNEYPDNDDVFFAAPDSIDTSTSFYAQIRRGHLPT